MIMVKIYYTRHNSVAWHHHINASYNVCRCKWVLIIDADFLSELFDIIRQKTNQRLELINLILELIIIHMDL